MTYKKNPTMQLDVLEHASNRRLRTPRQKGQQVKVSPEKRVRSCLQNNTNERRVERRRERKEREEDGGEEKKNYRIVLGMLNIILKS